jgi:hypothetical protein
MDEFVFFVHTHKCAGTSVIHLFGEDESFRACDNWQRNGAMPQYFQDLKPIESYDDLDAAYGKESIARAVAGFKRSGINFVATEWVVPKEENLPFGDEMFYFTILRDPFARFLSNYHFDAQRGYRRVPSPYQFRDASMFRRYNYYTRFFGSRLNKDTAPVTERDFERALSLLERFNAVIILEQPETFELLRPLGVDLSKLRRKNVSNRADGDYPAGFKEYFIENAKWDYMLYEEAKKITSRRL